MLTWHMYPTSLCWSLQMTTLRPWQKNDEDLDSVPSLLAFIAPQQRQTLVMLPEAVLYVVSSLLQIHVEEGVPVHAGLPW